ncbi:MAG: ABC transporter ATP-binding protein [Planctomycetes bacterium]|nr:ABC transporter ATP-binding protein [Planctomycetota bacterium]
MILLENVYKSYTQGAQRIEALRGVDLKLEGPGFFAVMGPSGSGKSTLLHLAAGLDRADSGRVVVEGEDLSTLGEAKLTAFRRTRVGIVFQKFNLIPTLTAEQNVALPGVIDRRPRREIDARVAALLRDLGLTDRATHRPDALSGGEQQRVAIARALFFSPALLLADEPTGNLDSASSERLWALLDEIAQRQKMTVVMVTHEPAAATRCRRVYVLGDGKSRGEFEVNGLDAPGVASRYQQLGR